MVRRLHERGQRQGLWLRQRMCTYRLKKSSFLERVLSTVFQHRQAMGLWRVPSVQPTRLHEFLHAVLYHHHYLRAFDHNIPLNLQSGHRVVWEQTAFAPRGYQRRGANRHLNDVESKH